MTEKMITENEMGLGSTLKEHRLTASLSVEEVAVKLNLKVSVIKHIEDDLEEIIEDEIYPSLYLRGYLVNFSKMVQLPNIESFPEYKKLEQPAKRAKTITKPYILKDDRRSPQKGKWFIFLLLLISGLAIFFNWSEISTLATASVSIEPEQVELSIPEATNNIPDEKILVQPLLEVHSLDLNAEA